MLTSLINQSDSKFKECVKALKYAFWPAPDLWEKHPEISDGNEILAKMASEKLYRVMKTGELYFFPFTENFHQLFKKRKSSIDEWFKGGRNLNAENIVQLSAPNDETHCVSQELPGGVYFYSENEGNYNHFLNVVMATARLIEYFTENEGHRNGHNIFFNNRRFRYGAPSNKDDAHNIRQPNYFLNEITYKKDVDMRTFKLMLSAFYHDIGKTVVVHRHGMEGAVILNDHNSDSWYNLRQICYASGIDSEFERCDLLYLSDMLRYHDFFGTLSTGEAGYIKLAEIINAIKQFGFRDVRAGSNEKWNRRRLFDLWLLNVADIMVSLRDKWKFQELWLSKKQSKKEINSFFQPSETSFPPSKSERLVHDLLVGFELLECVNKSLHADEIDGLVEAAKKQAANHAVERIKRILIETLETSLPESMSDFLRGHEEFSKNGKNVFYSDGKRFIRECFTEGEIRNIIISAIGSNSDFKTFVDRLALIGNMDYALGFFKQICEFAILIISEELSDPSKRTGWIRYSLDGDSIVDESDRQKVQAYFFLINFTSVVIRIINHLLFRQNDHQYVRNFEFKDASDRLHDTSGQLVDKKLRKMLSQEGPFRSDLSIHMILECIFTY